MTSSQNLYEVRPRKDHRGVDLISDALPFGGLWYGESNAISNAINARTLCEVRTNSEILNCMDICNSNR